MKHIIRPGAAALCMAVAALWSLTSAAQNSTALTATVVSTASYADLAGLVDSAPLVARVEVRKLAQLEPERARDVRPGWARFYVEAKTKALLIGTAPLGEALRYLVDLPLDAKGKPPKLTKQQVLLFGRTVPERPGELQLRDRSAQILWDAPTEARLRAIMAELAAPGAPGKVTGLREAIYEPGTLEGEGETQLFLNTSDDSAATVTVSHRPGQPASWGVSFSELVGGTTPPPARDTLAWYRLACFLPSSLPTRANLSDGPASRRQAEADYGLVMKSLGTCPRSRR